MRSGGGGEEEREEKKEEEFVRWGSPYYSFKYLYFNRTMRTIIMYICRKSVYYYLVCVK
jgi:hypothetical protein